MRRVPSQFVVRLKVAQLLPERGITAYALAQGAGFTQPRAYRLASEDGAFDRLEADAPNRLCEFFNMQPGELLEWVPDTPNIDKPKRRKSA
jgi:DNA-binding Xre family transcriptional regulator